VNTSRRLPAFKAGSSLRNLLAIRRDVLRFLSRVAAECGDIASFRVGPMRLVLLNHPDYIREVLLTNARNFVKGRPLRLAKRLLGDGLLTSEGEFHARQSRIVQPALHAERIRGYGSVVVERAERASGRWRDGDTLDVMREMITLATEIAGTTMFHWDMDPAVAAGVGAALDDAMSLFSRASIPLAEWLLKLPLPSSRRFHRARAHLDAVIYGLIAERRREPRDRGDLLSMLLLAQDREGDGGTMTDRQVRDEALTLFLTALDTTSLALTWTWYLLSQHPAVETELHAELDRVLGDRSPSMDDIERLAYTRMVFLEAMRLYPPIYAIARQAVDAFRVGGYTVPAGTLVLMSPYLMHRDPRYFAEPARFDPGRWDSDAMARPPKFAYFPFGGGPRGCIGQPYAMQEGILVLAAVARRWRLRLVPGYSVAFRPLINLRPRDGMPMTLECRRNGRP
jgi:cytochrome P450